MMFLWLMMQLAAIALPCGTSCWPVLGGAGTMCCTCRTCGAFPLPSDRRIPRDRQIVCNPQGINLINRLTTADERGMLRHHRSLRIGVLQ